MKKLTCVLLSLILVLSLLFPASCSESKKDNKTPESSSRKLVKKYNKKLKELSFKGGIYVSAKDKIFLNKGVGYADEELKIKNNETTLFFIASVTKQFTASAVMLLRERGKLSLNDKIVKYFPKYKYGKDITINDLLRMRSGIPDYMNMKLNKLFPKDYNPEKHSAAENRKHIKKAVLNFPLSFKAGTDFEYTNSGYFLLAEIIEKVSKTSYKDFLRKEIFDKLEMNSTGFIDENLDNKNLAKPYYSGEVNNYYKIKGMTFGCSDMISTAPNLAKWAKAFSSCKVITKSSLGIMKSVGKNKDYGCGLYVSGDCVYHSGSFTPYRSSLFTALDGSGFCCVVLSNCGFVQGNYLGKEFYKEYLKVYKKR